MPRVSTYPTKGKQELNKNFRLFGTDDNNSSSPQINLSIESILEFVRENIKDEVISDVNENFKPQYHYFTNETTVVIPHGLNKIPTITVLEGVEEIIPNSVSYDETLDSVTLTFLPATSGVVVIR